MKIKFNINFYLIGISFVILLSGCYYDNEEELYEYYYLQNNCEIPTTVSFQNDILPLFQGNCAISGCHVSGGNGNGIFNSYTGIKEKADNGSLRHKVIVEKSMPPSKPLNNCQLSLIDTWLNSGSPNN